MCQHLHTKVFEWDRTYQGEGGIEFEILSYTYCEDCGEEIEPPAFEVLAVDHEPTVFELETVNVLP